LVSRFDCVLAAVLHEDPSVTPQIINFTNEMAKSKFSPFIERSNQKIGDDIEGFGYVKTAEDIKGLERILREAEFLDNFMVGAGSGGFKVRSVTDAGSNWRIIEWETGAVWRVGTSKNVWTREYLTYPITSEEDLEDLELPDPDDPTRYEEVEKSIEYVVDKGFFPVCSINGFFSGVWYYLRGPLDVVLMDMYRRREFYKKVLAILGEFNLRAEKNLLERGAMMIGWVDDLGYSSGTFMSPKLYEELIYPWHVKAINLAHKYGAFVNMHSHGNVNAIVPLLVEAKLDVLNPIGPTDNMNLRDLKERYGDRLCLQGGLSKEIGLMSPDELREHLIDRIRIGSPGGGFILGSEGGIPYEMSVECFRGLIRLSRRYRKNKPP